jgi:hypothetical protein
MICPDISDLIGAKSCMDLILQVYERAGITLSDPNLVPDQAEQEWIEVRGKWEPGDVLDVEGYTPDYGGHGVLYLGWGLIFHWTEADGVQILPMKDLRRKVVAAYRHADSYKKA